MHKIHGAMHKPRQQHCSTKHSAMSQLKQKLFIHVILSLSVACRCVTLIFSLCCCCCLLWLLLLLLTIIKMFYFQMWRTLSLSQERRQQPHFWRVSSVHVPPPPLPASTPCLCLPPPPCPPPPPPPPHPHELLLANSILCACCPTHVSWC